MNTIISNCVQNFGNEKLNSRLWPAMFFLALTFGFCSAQATSNIFIYDANKSYLDFAIAQEYQSTQNVYWLEHGRTFLSKVDCLSSVSAISCERSDGGSLETGAEGQADCRSVLTFRQKNGEDASFTVKAQGPSIQASQFSKTFGLIPALLTGGGTLRAMSGPKSRASEAIAIKDLNDYLNQLIPQALPSYNVYKCRDFKGSESETQVVR